MLSSLTAIPSIPPHMCRSIVGYRGSCSPMSIKPSTEAGVQEECIVMELLKGGEGLPCESRAYSIHALSALSVAQCHSLWGCKRTECTRIT